MKLALLLLVTLVVLALVLSLAEDQSSPNPNLSEGEKGEEVQFEETGEGEVEGPPSRLLEAARQGDLAGIEEAINNVSDR